MALQVLLPESNGSGITSLEQGLVADIPNLQSNLTKQTGISKASHCDCRLEKELQVHRPYILARIIRFER